MISRPIVQRTLPSRFGPIEVVATDLGLAAVALRSTPEAVAADVRRRLAREGHSSDGELGAASAGSWVDATCRWLDDYLAGMRVAFAVPLDLGGTSAWDRRILDGVRTIPHGRTLGYGELARTVGSPGAARAAGGAVSRNPIALVIPCHRVIAGDGTLGGYGGAWAADRDELLDLKTALLAYEGVHIARPGRAA